MAIEQRWYKLDAQHNVVPCASMLEWAAWMETGGSRVVAQERIGPLFVSTVFLGLDHRHGPGAPLLFETMILDGGEDSYQTRAGTWAQAQAAHAEAAAVARARVERADTMLAQRP